MSKVRERQSFASHRHTRIYVLLSRHNVFLNGTLYKMNERTFRSKEPEESFYNHHRFPSNRNVIAFKK